MLKYEDVSRIEGLGWIEYRLKVFMWESKLSIEINGVDMVLLICFFKLISFLK